MKKTFILVGVALLCIIGFIIVRETKKPQTQETKAAVKNARIFLLPAQLNVSAEQTLQVWVTADAPVTFSQIVLTFDKEKIKVTKELSLTSALTNSPLGPLEPLLVLSTMTQANESGMIKFMLGLPPDTTGPTGTFQIATIKISPNTTQQNSATVVDVDLANSQLAADDASEFTLTKTAANIIVNTTETVTQTPTSTLTPTRTPTLTPTRTPTSTPILTHTPTPTLSENQQLLSFRVKLAGVTGDAAEGSKISVKFIKRDGTITQLSSPLTLSYVGNDIYKADAIVTNPLTAGTQLVIKIKGEKHVSVQFCSATGQTGICADNTYITIPSPTPNTITFDFTGVGLPPGDLVTQDGQVNRVDLEKLTPLMSKVCADLSSQERLIGDVDYNGCVNVRDVFLILQTLETRYDE